MLFTVVLVVGLAELPFDADTAKQFENIGFIIEQIEEEKE